MYKLIGSPGKEATVQHYTKQNCYNSVSEKQLVSWGEDWDIDMSKLCEPYLSIHRWIYWILIVADVKNIDTLLW